MSRYRVITGGAFDRHQREFETAVAAAFHIAEALEKGLAVHHAWKLDGTTRLDRDRLEQDRVEHERRVLTGSALPPAPPATAGCFNPWPAPSSAP